MKFNTVLFVNATIGFSENLFLVVWIFCLYFLSTIPSNFYVKIFNGGFFYMILKRLRYQPDLYIEDCIAIRTYFME